MVSNSSVESHLVEPRSSSEAPKSSISSGDGQMEEGVLGNSKGSIGVLEVYVHQARDIHNICIYHKQDVYAKIYLSDDPKTTASTKTVNGGGQNPVFNDNLRLNVRSIQCSLKCEVWMLSRVRNYLEDQLLGFALVPLADVLTENGKLAKEFTLSSSDVFHSPSGFVQLTLAYSGASPEVLEISRKSPAQDKEVPNSVSEELDRIEFPDPKIVNENEMMVTEYYGIPCLNLESQSSEILDNTKDDNHHIVETVVAETEDAIAVSKIETPSSVSTNGSSSISVTAGSQSVSDNPGASKSLKENVEDVGEAESGSLAVQVSKLVQPVTSLNVEPEQKVQVSKLVQPVISLKGEPEQKVVQQDYVDMYMKSMQQFTEALAKMKLPLDIGNGSPSSASSSEKESDNKAQSSKENGPSPRVFYGSRAFF